MYSSNIGATRRHFYGIIPHYMLSNWPTLNAIRFHFGPGTKDQNQS